MDSHEKQSPQRFGRYAAMLIMLLTLGAGQMWAWWFVPGEIHSAGWSATEASSGGIAQMNGSNTITFYNVPAGTYQFKLIKGSTWGNGNFNNQSSSVITTLCSNCSSGNNKIVTNAAKDLTFTITNEDTWWCDVSASAPTYYIKYNWNNEGWGWSGSLTSNGSNIYSCTGQYGGSGSYDHTRKSSTQESGTNATATVNNSPSTGDKCVFAYNSSTKALTITRCNKVTATNKIYFDNSTSNFSGKIFLVIGHDKPTAYSKTYELSNLAGTKLYYASVGDTWDDATYYAIIANSSSVASGSWGSGSLSSKGTNGYTAAYTGKYDLDGSNKQYLFTTASSGNGQALTITYKNTGYSNLNYTQTVKLYSKAYGAASYSANTSSLTSLNFTTYNLTAVGTVSTQQTNNMNGSTGVASGSACQAATTTINVGDAPASWVYDGIFTSENGGVGDRVTTEQTFTYYPTAAKTYYARFHEVHDPSVSLAASSSYLTTTGGLRALKGETITLTATAVYTANTLYYTYEYSTNSGSTWTNIATRSSSNTQTFTASSTGDYIFRVTLPDEAGTPKGTTNVHMTQMYTINVKKNASWTPNKLYIWNKSSEITQYGAFPGATGKFTNKGEWYSFELNSDFDSFIISASSHTTNHTADVNNVSADGCYTIGGTTGTSCPVTSGATCPSAPSVSTSSATSVGATSVTFNASSVSANNDAITEYGFKWGTTSACSSGTVTASNLGGGTSFSASKSSLTNGTTYYFKAYATNGQGTTYGDPVSVRTMFVTTVTLDMQGGSGGTSSVDATEGSSMPTGKTAPSKTGYTFGGYYKNTGGSGTQYYNSSMGSAHNWDVAASTATIYAKWTPITYTISFNGNGKTSGTMSNQTGVAYDSETTITANAFVRTGYTFAGWSTSKARADAGTIDRTDGAAHGNLSSTDGATVTLFASWTAKTYTLTLDVDEEHHGSIAGATTSQTVTYGSAPSTIANRPTAENGYGLAGYYTDQAGEGLKVINGDGTWVASVTGYTDGSGNWVRDDDATLYAYYKKAEITSITFSPGTVVENNSTVSVTATISPTPTGTTCVCWRVLYDNGSALDPQPEFTPASAKGTSVSFTAPNASGMYKVEAKLSTGSTCGAGTLLDTETADFQVAGSHTVTVAYKHSGTDIAASTSVTGRPLEWTEVVTHEIFGYTFSSWTAGDGITIRDTTAARLAELQAVDPTIVAVQRMKAIYNGTLTANYTPKSLIYFKNTLGWENVYVNFYKSDYWNDSKGSGNNSVPVQNKAMTRLGETDIWYYDYGSDNFTGYTNTKPTNYVSFTSISQTNAENFWASGTGISASYPARRADDLADKSGETGFYESTPMFVPLAGQTAITKNENGGGKALYYNSGYWTKYLPGTGYTLEFYNNGSGAFIKSMDFTSADELMPMKAVADLEGNTTYKFQIKRHGDVYLGNSGTMTYSNHGQTTPWEMTNTDFSMCRITTTAAGDYTFNFTYSANASNAYRLRLSVDYPVANGDYRLVYNDDTRSGGKPSAIIQKENNGSAIVSFFVRKDQHPKLYMQQASVDGAGNITWREYPTTGTPTNQITGDIASAITKDTVYNFNLSMNGSGALSVTSAEYYSGNFYIRTDAANSKWDNYRTDPDHLMTYSEYLKSDVGYSHYYTHWVNKDDVGRKNVKFVIENDYSPCISDTLAREAATGTWANIDEFMYEGGDLKRSANVRFMWDIKTNNIARAYIDGAQGPGSNFYLLLLSNDSKIKQGETTKTEVSFDDNGNWIYEANVKAQPNAQIKLKSTWGEGTTIVQYFKGSASETETLIGGSGTTWYDIRLLYDFKTNRLVAAYVPATGTISTDNPINADVMFIREHQGDVAQLTFTGSGAISKIQTAYGVLRLNKWTVNNKSTAPGHAPLSPELSRFERDMFYISFPFRVNLEEVFGFGTYGTHWIIEEYDGAGRAANGFWADTPTFWRFITNRKGKFLEPNTGYIVAIDLDKLGESSSVWANTDQVELFFPSYENLPNITSSSVTYELEAHTCTIGPRFPGGDDRRIKDSHWNVMSVPTYINTDDVTFANNTWITAGDGQLGPNFLYTWNMNDNTLSATSGVGYEYKAMHAYIVQYCGNVTWTTSVSPALAPRRNPKAQKDVEFRIELQQNEEMIDRTFVRLSNDEAVTNGFEFNYDLSKEFNKNKANIYTMVTTIMEDGPSVTETAGNCLPMTEQTIVVPMGVMIAKTGEYTISIPSGTSGIGVTLIDNETGIRTNLALEDYTVALEAGTQNDRFYLEISPITHVATDIENTEVGNQNSDVRKVMVDGILYIIKDGKVFSTQGARVK